MTSDSESDEYGMPQEPEFLKVEMTTQNLPEKSRKKYETIYKTFMDWRNLNSINSFSENVLLDYFQEISEKYKSPSLWAQYSMLKSTLNINNSINIEHYSKLRQFLKRQSEGYRTKTANTFTPHEINKFIKEAPDNTYLATKVALIMGVMGACRANQLHSMDVQDLQDLGSAVLVTVPNTKTKTVRKFTITGHFYQIYKKYADLRPSNIDTTSFFLNYHNGKCIGQKIGINKLGAMGKQIATFLKLPNPGMYTGHTFRKSSATLLMDTAGDFTTLERHGWKSESVEEVYVDEDDSLRNNMDTADNIYVEDPMRNNMDTKDNIYVDDSMRNSMDAADNIYEDDSMRSSIDAEEKIFQSVKQSISTYTKTSTTNENINIDGNSTPCINLTNCSNITINFITRKCDK